MALKGLATRIVGPGVVLASDMNGKAIRSLGLPAVEPGAVPPATTAAANSHSHQTPEGEEASPARDYCSAGRSACPAILSCYGDQGCSLGNRQRPDPFGSFDDTASTAAFGCDQVADGVVGATAANESKAGPHAICRAPSARVAQELSSIAGWGSEWSGKYPPWAYNMNTGCPCLRS